MTKRIRTMVVAAAMLSLAGAARADDIWDLVAPSDDGCVDSSAELVHGARQVHDLQGGGAVFFDADWMRVQQRLYRSYEVRVQNSGLRFAQTATAVLHTCSGGALQTAVPYEGAAQDAVSLRWLATGEGDAQVRVFAGDILGANSLYEIQLLETTYSVPRFNNSATQQTVLQVQNTRGEAVNGQIHFFKENGSLLHSQAFAVAARGLLVLNTASLAPVVGQSGSVLIAHDGGYGALAGKAVALEPATGFTFDTPLSSKPY